MNEVISLRAARRFLLPTFLLPRPMSIREGEVYHVSLCVIFGKSTMMQVLVLFSRDETVSIVEMERHEVGFTRRNLLFDPRRDELEWFINVSISSGRSSSDVSSNCC